MRLPEGHAATADDGDDRERRQRDEYAVAVDEAAQAVSVGVGTREDRSSVAPAAQIVGERFDGRIAARRFRVGRTGDDDAGIAGQRFRGNRGRAACPGVFARGGEALRGSRCSIVRHVGETHSAQQFMQQGAKLEDVGRGRREESQQLLGRRVGARKEACGRRGRGLVGVGLEHACDAEVEQMRCAVACDQNVCRLDVAVHDQLVMRMCDRRAQREDEFNSCVESGVGARGP